MIRKICPICEQAMTLPHYCKYCRQFVKTPYVRDITYYLNESHPQGERNCDYHGVRVSAETKRDSGPKAGQARREIRLPERSGRQRGGAIRGSRAGFVLVGVFVLFQTVTALVKAVPKTAVPDYEEETDTFRLLSDEEARETGKACTLNGHYSISGSSMEEEMERIVAETGYEIEGRDTDSWNYVDGEGDDLLTDYDSTVYYQVKPAGSGEEDTLSDSVSITYDTVTGQLHGVNFYVSEIRAAADMAAAALDVLEKYGEILPDEAWGGQVEDEILKYSDRSEDEKEGGRYLEIPGEKGQTEVYFHETDGAFYVRIWRPEDL